MDYLKKFLRQDRDYFCNNAADIRRQNGRVLRFACAIYLLILAIYTTITVLTGQSRALCLMYYAYDAVHVLLCFAVFSGAPNKPENDRRTAVCRVLFELTLLSFFALEAVFPFPTQQSIYFPFPIILLLMVFVYSVPQALTLIFSYVGVFVLLTCLFKSGIVRINDIYVASGTLISALTGYAIVTARRHEAAEAMGRLKSLSMSDVLTGLYNKDTFCSLCTAFMEKEPAHGYALLFIDIDSFKQINDRFGHQVGDAVLQSVSGVMRDAFYEKDYLCRFGGDEFMIFMADAQDQASVNERVRIFQERVHALSRTLKTDDFSCSVGVAMKSSRPETYEDLVARADAALYVAKKSAGRQVSLAEQHFMHTAFMGTGADLPFNVAPPIPTPRSPRRTVLIVDDNEINRRLLFKILSPDYEVLQAENGMAALDVLRIKYDIVSAVLLDIIMPVMDGYETLAQMRADENLSHIPVIVTTGNTEAEAEIKALSLGANDFIVKPYQPAIILHRLQNTINLRETAAIINATERDALTGVYTQDFFYQKAEALLRADPTARYDIVCCDVEHFKLINELFGKKVGDELLKYLASLIVAANMGRGICGRIGVDRFASLTAHRDTYDNADFEAASKALNEFPIAINISARYGVYVVGEELLPVSTMCDRALTACNSIKGKYGVYYAYYDDAFRQQTLAEQFILDSMKAGLGERQFQVYYQPKYDLETGAVVGAEALVRWVHPERGFMSPAEFIPLFERNGFITDLDVYVWDTACADLQAWIASGKAPVPVSVNVSRVDIYNERLPDILTALIEKYELPAGYLHLEITETAYTEDSGQLVAMVKKLRALGFLIEMDDFGSGYSSLNMLSDLPIDVLKLDMSLTREIANTRKRSIVSVVTALAGELGLSVVAEGVETERQAELLREMGCNYVQGYYYAKPMPRMEFELHLKNGPRARNA